MIFRGSGGSPHAAEVGGSALTEPHFEGLAEGCVARDRGLSAVLPILCRKGPVEAKPECQETETKPAPADVETVPNDAPQTKENESKA